MGEASAITTFIAQFVSRIIAFIYAGAFALAGHLAWMQVWRPWLGPLTDTSRSAPPLDQVAAGLAHVAQLIGVMAGLLIGAIVFVAAVRWRRRT